MTRQLWMTAALFALGACASTPATGGSGAAPANPSLDEAAGDVVVIEPDGRTSYATLQGTTMKGREVSVTLEGDTARGEAFGAPVNLSLAQGQLTGEVGAQQTSLQLEPTQGGIRAQGLFRGEQSEFSVSPNMLTGNVASCRYDLKRSSRGNAFGGAGAGGSVAAVDYKGQRSCAGGQPAKVTVKLPSGFERLAPAQQATILGLMLGRAP